MSSASDEIELLERVLFRLGAADTDEKLESTVGRFLTPVILKITSPNENVRAKVIEVLTHIKRRVTSRSQVQLPVDALLDQYVIHGYSPFLLNFAIIFIIMGYPRLSIESRSELASKVVGCEENMENYQDKFFMLLLPILGEIKVPDDPKERSQVLKLDDKPKIRKNFLNLLLDVLLLPYGITPEHDVPPGMSTYSFKRVTVSNWRAEELEQIKKGIVRFICTGVFNDQEIFVLLVVASADTRFSVATPAIAELSKVSTVIDFSDPHATEPLYVLFSGNRSTDPDRKTNPCCARVRQKLLQYLIKCRGKGINPANGIQVIFEGLFGANTNQKCKVLALQFAENLIKDGPIALISKLAKVILGGIGQIIGRESSEPIDVQNAAYTAMAQLARTCPEVVNEDLKIVLSYFNHLANAPPELHSSIREALVSMAPAFSWEKKKYNVNNDEDVEMDNEIHLSGQQHLLLAMLSDNAEAKLHIIQNVTSVFLTTCFPESYAPARYLLLLIAGERNSLRENVTTYLYGVSKKDHVNYNMLSSIEYPEEASDDFNKSAQDQKRVVLPSFKSMMQHVHSMTEKRLAKSSSYVVVGRTKLPFTLEVYEEVLDYLRVCLWYSAGIRSFPGDERYAHILKQYIANNYEESDNNELHQYLQFVQRSIEAKRTESNLICLYDLLHVAPELIAKSQMHLLQPLSNSLKDISETMRINVAQVYGILLANGYSDDEFNTQVSEYIADIKQKSLEHKHGWLLVIGHAFSRKLENLKANNSSINIAEWKQFVEAIKLISKMLCETQWLLVSAALNCISMIGKIVIIPNVAVEITIPKENDEDEVVEFQTATAETKTIIFTVVFSILRSTSTRAKIREVAAKCMGHLAIGDGSHFTQRNLEKFLSLVKVPKDAALNIAISEAIVSTLNGYDVTTGTPPVDFVNEHCDEKSFEAFLNSIIRLVPEPNPHSRQATSVWLLGIVKHCSHHPTLLNKKEILQFAFTELLSDDSEFVQDVASRGLGLVYSLSSSESQHDLANSLLNQLIGGKRSVNKVTEETELFPEGTLGKTPMGGNITTYKELCALASDLNQPEMVYQFMQLANHNAAWTSKLGAAFGLKSLSKNSKAKMQPYLGKIIPRLYRYKYDPTPKIQNSMISIWDSIVTDSKEVVEKYYWEILREILDNLTFKEWRVRIACCLAVRDLLKRSNGLRLRTEENMIQKLKVVEKSKTAPVSMEVDEVPEPELKELWSQLFRVMDDIHEGTRQTAQGTVTFLSKVCVVAASSDHGKSGLAVSSSILPLLLETGVTHTVADIRKISIRTISELIDSSGSLIKPHLAALIPCLLKATGELDSTKLSYLSARLGNDNEAQEAVDSLRAEAAKSHHTTETITKCVRFLDYESLEQMTPAVLELMKTSVNLGTKITCAHFVCLLSIHLSKEMTPLVAKYLGACFVGLKDRNPTVRKYSASAIGHLMGNAKEQSIKNLFVKLDELYMESPSNRSVVQTIHAINKRHPELLKDYLDSVIPLVFFAMHEEQTEENKAHIESWKDLWNEISPGDAGIRLNLNVIIPKLEKSLNDASWHRKAQAANAIHTIAQRLWSTIGEDRIRLINLLLVGLQGRTFDGKQRLLQALAALCKGLDNKHEVCERLIESAMRECRKEEPRYRTNALSSLGDILEELNVDRFEDVYNMIWYLLDEKDLRKSETSDDEDNKKDLTADERNKRAQIFNKLKETVCDTLGKSWPKNAIETQNKYQIMFAERCSLCLKDNTRPVQVSLLVALTKFLDRLRIFDELKTAEVNQIVEKKLKVDTLQTREVIVQKICNDVLSAVSYAAGVPHTGLRKEALNIVLILIKRLSEANDMKQLQIVKKFFEEEIVKFQKDNAPEVRCRINDIEDKLSKITY
ncbi:proteasome-associated protein ECM29 homolog [Teleopsis dalmanni]|uniref:proteasome-associated protein ECM29 homolog n=1 Tax=Teleopsis dalmanni TaxID=139649 RepID=UPI0018CFE8FC|nr:proteasome-associated protein ECM29 homolog [Teleopsis dalmanni]